MRVFTLISRLGMLGVCAVALAGCSSMDSTTQRVAGGGAVGAAAGTVSTLALGGCIPCGTVVGAAVGATSGYVYDQIEKQTQ